MRCVAASVTAAPGSSRPGMPASTRGMTRRPSGVATAPIGACPRRTTGAVGQQTVSTGIPRSPGVAAAYRGAGRAAGFVRSRAARVKPRERPVRGAAARAGVELLARVVSVRCGGPVRGEPGELRRVAGAPVAGEVGQELAVDRGVRALEQPGVLPVRDAERGDDLVRCASLEIAHRPYRARPPLDGEQDVGDDLGDLAPLDLLADRGSPVSDPVDAAAPSGGADLVVRGRRVAALAAQLHLALVDDHLAQEGAGVANRLAVALAHPGRGRGDLEQVAEGVAPS